MGWLKNHGFFKEKHLEKFSYGVLQTPSWKRQVIHILGMENGNWEAHGENKREKLIPRIKQYQKKIDQSVIIKMFDNLKAKVHTANEFGLRSLDKWWLHMIL